MKTKFPRLFFDRLGPRGSAAAAVLLILIVAFADALTGYQIRLSILYLAPIALASWGIGAAAGIVLAVLSSLIWFVSFSSKHLYLHQGYFLWEAAVMLLGFLAFAWLIARLRRALQQADERFFRVIEEMRAAVYVADKASDNVIYANPEMVRIAGAPAILTPGELRRAFVQDADSKRAATEVDVAAPIVRNIGNGRYYLMQERAIPWVSNKHVTLTVLSDITEHREAEMLREKHREILRRVAQQTMLAEIASSLAHEINQPLMVIAAYTDACQRLLEQPGYDHDEITRVIGKCHAQAARASQVIERMRDFIRHPQPRLERCDVKAAVEEALGILQPGLDEFGVRVDSQFAGGDYIVSADKILLVQILVNLMCNAIDAMREMPAVQRCLSIAAKSGMVDEIVISVTDYGPGLDQATLEEIFHPFFTTKVDGLGLGLPISRSIAEAHGGRLWVSSSKGRTTFNLSLAAWKAE